MIWYTYLYTDDQTLVSEHKPCMSTMKHSNFIKLVSFFFNRIFSSCKCWERPRSLTTWHFMPWHSIASASFAVCFMDGPSLRVIGTRSGTGASRHSFGLPSKDRALDLKRVGWVSSEDSKRIMWIECESTCQGVEKAWSKSRRRCASSLWWSANSSCLWRWRSRRRSSVK